MEASRMVTDLFCIATLIFLRSWNLPDGRFSRRIISKFSKFFFTLGLSHTWSMFAPKPISNNDVLRFKIVYTDDTFTYFIPPYFPTLESNYIPSDVRHLKVMHSLSTEGNTPFKESFSKYILENHLKTNETEKLKPSRLEFLLVREPEARWGTVPCLEKTERFEKTVHIHFIHG